MTMAERFIRLEELQEKLNGVHRSTIHKYVKNGTLPKPIKTLGVNHWLESAIDDLLRKWAEEAGQIEATTSDS